MTLSPVVVSLPIADRRTSFRLYREGGVPEPLRFALNEGVWLNKGAHQAGAEVVTEPGRQPWGYADAFADPDGHVWMVTAESLPA